MRHLAVCLGLATAGLVHAGGVIGRDGRGPSPLVYSPEYVGSRSRWMTDAYSSNRNVRLIDICIPGTHDAGTKPIDGLLQNLGKTQDHTILEQLQRGVRYLDLRVKKVDGEFKIHHGDAVANLAQESLDEIKTFTDANPNEVVIVHVQNVDSMNEEEQADFAANNIISTFGTRLAPRWIGTTTSFGRMWDNGKRIILVWGGANYATLSADFWYQGSTLTSWWSDTSDGSDLINAQIENVEYSRSSRFHVSQMILTPQVEDIILPPYYGSIEDLTNAKIDHATFTYRLDYHAKRWGLRANIQMVDFAETDEQYGVNACLDVNDLQTHWFALKNVESGRCLDVFNHGTADPTNVVTWGCTGQDNQQWRFEHDTGFLKSKLDDTKCLMSFGVIASSTNVVLATCGTTDLYRWEFYHDTLRSRGNIAVSVDSYGTSDGSEVALWESHDGDNQRWTKIYQ